MTAFHRVLLPDGLEVWAPSALEAAVLYREIVTERTYQQQGITLADGAVIFDVGANIGLFTIHLARSVPHAQIHCFEPIPDLFEILTRNLAEHAPHAHAHHVGLAARDGDAVFTFDRFMTLGATMYPSVWGGGADRRASLASWVVGAIGDMHKVQPTRRTAMLMAVTRHALGRAALIVAAVPVLAVTTLRQRMFLKRHRCRLQTLSSALAESGVTAVDLVKIDVEGAEEDVLNGIADADWPRLRQFVIEVHDIEGRPARLAAMLEARGYRTVRKREDWALHALLGISTLYAVRR
jgi:hypothetical protein